VPEQRLRLRLRLKIKILNLNLNLNLKKTAFFNLVDTFGERFIIILF